MTKTNTNRSRKAKATVRTTRATLDKRNKRLGGKPRSPQTVTADINTRKVNKALNSKAFTQEPQYYVGFTFSLNSDQDMNDPIRWLEGKMGEKECDRLVTGSGTCLFSGLRDFGFQGSKSEMTAVLKWFAHSPFRINTIYTDTVEID